MRRRAADLARNRVVRAREVALGLELDVGREPETIVPRRARVSELEHHLAPQNAARVHIWHREHVF